MAESVSAVAMADSAREAKQVRTVVWVILKVLWRPIVSSAYFALPACGLRS
jgi:hypothetical protein